MPGNQHTRLTLHGVITQRQKFAVNVWSSRQCWSWMSGNS